MQQIAKTAGVSYTTVSYVLNERYKRDVRIKPETIAKVKRIAEDVGWIPNRLASSLVSQKSNMVMFIYVSGGGYYFPIVFEHAQRVLHEHGLLVVSVTTLISEETEQNAIDHAVSLGCDGVVFASSANRPEILKPLEQREIPCVGFDQFPKHLNHSVRTDDIHGMTLLLEKLYYEYGQRRFIFVTYDSFFAPSIYERRKAFRMFAKKYDDVVTREWVHSIHDPKYPRWEAFPDEVIPILKREPHTTVVCSGDGGARNVIIELNRAGLSVPEDVSVTGYGNTANDGSLFLQKLVSVDQPKKILGETIGNTLAKIIEYPEERAKKHRIKVKPTFVEGDTVRVLPPAVKRESPVILTP